MKHTTYSPKDHAENPRNWPRLEAEGNRAADDDGGRPAPTMMKITYRVNSAELCESVSGVADVHAWARAVYAPALRRALETAYPGQTIEVQVAPRGSDLGSGWQIIDPDGMDRTAGGFSIRGIANRVLESLSQPPGLGLHQGLGAEGAEAEPRKTASDAVAAVNRGRVGSLAIPHSREYLEALRRQVQDWLGCIEEELGISSVDAALDAYEILERRALSAVPGSVHNGEYTCPSGRASIDLNGMADELAEVGSADVRTHRTGRPRARELDRVLAAWRSAGLEIDA